MEYYKPFGGYIADVPKAYFKRCDKRIFVFDELTQASASPQNNPITVNGGWSIFPTAYLPGQGTFDLQLTSSKFDADLFAMTNATKYTEDENFTRPVSERLTVEADKVTLTETPVVGTVSIAGLAETDGEVSAGTFKVEGKQITFNTGEMSGEIEVSYYMTAAAQVAEISNTNAAVGEAVLDWPVYASGDDCTQAGIIGHFYMKIYKARVTSQPGMDSSYKTAGTYQFTLSAMDAKRPDGSCYACAYIRA